jgi:hypothetical protein
MGPNHKLERMDSKIVNREIRSIIWAELKTAGFNSFSTRTAWRHGPDTVDVLNFQSFNSYNADILGVTTFSFSVNLGCFLQYVPPRWPPKVKDGRFLPTESECQFRGRLHPQISQRGKVAKDVWAVDEKGQNLTWCMRDVAQQIPSALQWFRRLERKEEVLNVLLAQNESMSALWGFGANPSPVRSYLSGYVALHLGQDKLARAKLQEAISSKCFADLFSSVEGAVQRAL